MQSLTRLTVFLCCLWIVTLLYGEMVAYWTPHWTCSWPHLRPSFPSSNGYNFVKVAVLADPQLVDWTSYGLPPKSLALEAAQFYTDLYMRRSFHLSILPFRPDFIIFLGDLFNGGSSLSDEEWKESLNRFEHIFSLSEKDGFQIPIYYVPGNHDIGFASFHSQYPKVTRRYEDHFGERNYQFSVGNVDFIVVDAQILDELGKETSFSWDFVRNISNDARSNPKVLLTHIPLHRPNETVCDLHQSSPVISQKISVTGTDFGKSCGESEQMPSTLI